MHQVEVQKTKDGPRRSYMTILALGRKPEIQFIQPFPEVDSYLELYE